MENTLLSPAYLHIRKYLPKTPDGTEDYVAQIGNLSVMAQSIKEAIEYLRSAIKLEIMSSKGRPGFYETDIEPEISENTLSIYRLPQGLIRWAIGVVNDPVLCKLVKGQNVL